MEFCLYMQYILLKSFDHIIHRHVKSREGGGRRAVAPPPRGNFVVKDLTMKKLPYLILALSLFLAPLTTLSVSPWDHIISYYNLSEWLPDFRGLVASQPRRRRSAWARQTLLSVDEAAAPDALLAAAACGVAAPDAAVQAAPVGAAAPDVPDEAVRAVRFWGSGGFADSGDFDGWQMSLT